MSTVDDQRVEAIDATDPTVAPVLRSTSTAACTMPLSSVGRAGLLRRTRMFFTSRL